MFIKIYRLIFILFFLFLLSCTKKVGKSSVTAGGQADMPKPCDFQNNTVISYSVVIHQILAQNCLLCHTKPGSGGINLDAYADAAQIGLNGQLMPVITNSDPMNIMMPPPPQKHLDSCQLKAINLWVTQGCLNN